MHTAPLHRCDSSLWCNLPTAHCTPRTSPCGLVTQVQYLTARTTLNWYFLPAHGEMWPTEKQRSSDPPTVQLSVGASISIFQGQMRISRDPHVKKVHVNGCTYTQQVEKLQYNSKKC